MKLSTEQSAQVFFLYSGQFIRLLDDSGTNWYLSGVDMGGSAKIWDWNVPEKSKIVRCEQCKLLLSSQISKEDAIEVAKIVFSAAQSELSKIGRDYVKWNYLDGSLNSDARFDVEQFSTKDHLRVYFFLISKGYAVPLPWEWAESKTAIELELAIDKTKLP